MATKRLILLVAAACSALSACGGGVPKRLDAGNYARPIGTAPVTANPTPYSTALNCLASYARQNHVAAPRIAVGRIADYTGKEESDGSGRKVTQGASLMAMTAFAKAGMPMVERFDTSVSELELKYANNKLISDRPAPTPDAPADYRKIVAGQVPGSDFYLVGGVTELNYNIQSTGAEGVGQDASSGYRKHSAKRQTYVMNVGVDLRLVDTKTLRVVDLISYQKQVVGREISNGLYDFLNGNVFELSAGKGALEPMQLAVRMLIERAVVEMSANLYGMPGPQSCLSSDPFGDEGTGPSGGFTPSAPASNNGRTRADPSRWRKPGEKPE